MKQKNPVMALAAALVLAALIVFGVYSIERMLVKENALVKANNEVEEVLATKIDFDEIVEYTEGEAERSRFLGIVLTELAKNEDRYESNFEERYPRYKAYRDMVKELAHSDYSGWVAAIISGEEETEFDANVFEYISELKDDRYLDAAVSRFVKIVEQFDTTTKRKYSDKDAFIAGALGWYISQFPANNSVPVKTAMGPKKDVFAKLSPEDTDTPGIPLNKLFISMYLKYFGLQDFIKEQMDAFMAEAKPGSSWDGIWTEKQVNNLIDTLSDMGEGMSQNYYSMFATGFEEKNAVYIYIALKTLKNIGFDDKALHDWLDRNYRSMEGRLRFGVINPYTGEVISSTPIIIADEIQKVREAIKGKPDKPFEETLKLAVKKSSRDNRLIIPRVSADEEVQREMRNSSARYTKDHVTRAVKTWALKRQLLLVIALICFAAAIACSCAVCFDSSYRKEKREHFLAWIVLPAVALALFIFFWNNYKDLTGFMVKPLIAFFVIGGVFIIVHFSTKMLAVPGAMLWHSLLGCCGSFNYRIKLFDTAMSYYELADLPLDKFIKNFIRKNDIPRILGLLRNSNNAELSMRIINDNASFFRTIDPQELESIFFDRLAWIEWLKAVGWNETLEKIRSAANTIITAGIPDPLIQDNRQYSGFIADLAAFDHTPENRHAIENIISNTLIKRFNSGNKTMPDTVCRVINQAMLQINPPVLFAMMQEGTERNSWIWKRLEMDAKGCETPDSWFAALLSPLDQAKLQKNMDITYLLGIIKAGFSRCTVYFPVLLLLLQAKEYIEKNNSYTSGQEYNRILELNKEKIAKAQAEARSRQ